MIYSNDKSDIKRNFFTRFKVKTGKMIAQHFPLNIIRVLGLRICGYKIGKYVYIGSDLIIASLLGDKRCSLEIGDRAAIGPRVTIILSSDANWSNLNNYIKPIRGKVVIKNDCWIGAGSIILPDIVINEMSVIGAGAVVTKDVAANTVVAGVPAEEKYKIQIR